MLGDSNFSSKHFFFQATIDRSNFFFVKPLKKDLTEVWSVFPQTNTIGFLIKTYFHQTIKFLCFLTTEQYKNAADKLAVSRTAEWQIHYYQNYILQKISEQCYSSLELTKTDKTTLKRRCYVTNMRPLISVESIRDQACLFKEVLIYIFAKLLQADLKFSKINIH